VQVEADHLELEWPDGTASFAWFKETTIIPLTNSRKESTTMSNITLDIKLAHLSDTDRLLYQEGIIDDNAEPTALGHELARTKLFEAHKADILRDVQEAVAKRPAKN
jgi:hypothetical protein